MSELSTEKNTSSVWKCTVCGNENTGNFCTNCGTRKPTAEVASQPVPPRPVQPLKKESKRHPVLQVFLVALLSGTCGLGGGYLAAKHTGNNTVIYKAAPITSPSSANQESGSLSIQDIAAKASPGVVEIRTEMTEKSYGLFGGSYTSQAAGSGVIISKDGYIITNNHVVEGANSIKVTTYDGTVYDAKLVGTDKKSDIAVLKVEADNLSAVTVGDSSAIQVGQTAVVIGNPLGTLGGTVTDGIISATGRELTINNESMTLIQTNAAINSGNSGGGLFDGNGNLIGIVNAKDSGTTSSGATIEGLGFAIPINEAMDVAEQLIANGYVANRPTIGVSLQTLANDYGDYPAGLYIAGVVPDSGAEKAGLKPYDRIVGADGNEISDYAALSRILQTKKVGDTIKLTIVRENEKMNVDVTLGNSVPATTKE